MIYLSFSATVLVVSTLLLLVGLIRPKRLKKLTHHRLSRTESVKIFVPVIVLAAGGVGFSFWLHTRQVQDSAITVNAPSLPQSPPPKIAASPKLPGYEIVSTQTNGPTVILSVYVASADITKITLLNNELYAQYNKPPIKTVTISYFDDKTVAQQYFDGVKNNKLSAAQRKLYVAHYQALMIETGQIKQIIRPNQGQSGIAVPTKH